jgi:hypothetical protein
MALENCFFADNWEAAACYQPDLFLNVTRAYENWIKACALADPKSKNRTVITRPASIARMKIRWRHRLAVRK